MRESARAREREGRRGGRRAGCPRAAQRPTHLRDLVAVDLELAVRVVLRCRDDLLDRNRHDGAVRALRTARALRGALARRRLRRLLPALTAVESAAVLVEAAAAVESTTVSYTIGVMRGTGGAERGGTGVG